MKFFTNKIPTNSSGSFSDLIQKVAGGDQPVKTASVKTAEEDGLKGDQDKLPEALKNEIREDAGHEAKDDDGDGKAEKTEEGKEANADAKVVEAEAGVDDEGEGKRTDVHHEEGSANDQNGEAEEDGENKTVDPAGLSEASAEEEVKIASDEGDSGENEDGVNTGRFPEEFEPKQEAQDDGKADVEADSDSQVKEASDDDDDDDDDHGHTDSDGNPDADGKDDAAEKEGCGAMASSDSNFEKIANLTGPEKNRLKEYFRRYYPERYADALTQDK